MGCTFGISQAFVTATAMLAIADVLWADATFATTDVHSNWNITRTFIQPRFSMWLAMKLKQPFEMPTFLCDIFHFLSFNFCRKTYMPRSTKSNVLWGDPPSTWLLNPSRASNIGSATFHRTYLFLPKSPVQLGIANIWKLKKCEELRVKKIGQCKLLNGITTFLLLQVQCSPELWTVWPNKEWILRSKLARQWNIGKSASNISV